MTLITEDDNKVEYTVTVTDRSQLENLLTPGIESKQLPSDGVELKQIRLEVTGVKR